MIYNPHLFALYSALFWSLILILYRVVMTKSADVKVLMIVGQIGAFTLLACVLGLPDLPSFSLGTIQLMIAGGLCWALGVYLEVCALKYLEATASGVIGAFRYVISFTIGIIIFSEALDTIRLCGALLIILAIIGISSFERFSFRKGFWLQMASALPQVIAYSIDKKLTTMIPVSAIAVSSFFFPGMTVLLLCPKSVLNIRKEFSSHKLILPLLPVCLAFCYYFIVAAFAHGQFISVMAVAETALIFTWLLAFVFLKEREEPIRKLCCCMACALGVVLVCAR